jgi:hypothetical protein
VSAELISYLERGLAKDVGLKALMNLAAALECKSVEELVGPVILTLPTTRFLHGDIGRDGEGL